MPEYTTTYSEWIKGDEGNHEMLVRFDKTGQYLGVNSDAGDRILLSPAQAQALIAFSKTRSRTTVDRR